MNSITKHAKARIQQRGIPTLVVDLILAYGAERNRPGGAIEYSISKSEANRLESKLKKAMNSIDKCKNIGVLVGGDAGSIITVYHK
jgi:hypothetical protein